MSGVKAMVKEVLEILPTPYNEHVIDEVFQAIESNPKFLSRYRTQLSRHCNHDLIQTCRLITSD